MPIKLLIIIAAIVAIFLSAMGIISSYISPQDTLVKADVIVAISGGDTKARATEAIALYEKGWAPNIIFSGAAFDPLSPSNAEVMQSVAEASGVPKGVITLEENARDTEENAKESKDIVDEYRYKTIILVTSPYHQRRAYIEFRNILGPDVKIVNHSAPDSDWDSSSWWQTPRGWWLTTSEALKIPFSIVKGKLSE